MSLRAIDPMTAYFAVFAAGGGFFALVWPDRAQARIEAAHQQKLADRMARGSDAYFEELRSLQAYAPKGGIVRRRIIGGFFLALGLGYFLFIFFA
jgi:hypothetical protein